MSETQNAMTTSGTSTDLGISSPGADFDSGNFELNNSIDARLPFDIFKQLEQQLTCKNFLIENEYYEQKPDVVCMQQIDENDDDEDENEIDDDTCLMVKNESGIPEIEPEVEPEAKHLPENSILAPEPHTLVLAMSRSTISRSTKVRNRKDIRLQDVYEELNLLAENIKGEFMSQEWNDGLKEYFFDIEQYIKENDHYEGCKNTCFAYKMIMLEEHINWEKIDDYQCPESPKSPKSTEPSFENKQTRKMSATSLQSATESLHKLTSKLKQSVRKTTDEKTNSQRTHGEDISAARFSWQNHWRRKAVQLKSPLILSNILMRALHSNSYFLEGASLDEYSLYVANAAECLLQSADRIDKITTKTGVAKLASGGTGLIAAGIGVTGLVLAPPTGGLSLGLTIGSMTAGLTAGATSLTATIVKNKHVNETIKETRAITKKAIRYSLILKQLVEDNQSTFETIRMLIHGVEKAKLTENLQKRRMNTIKMRKCQKLADKKHLQKDIASDQTTIAGTQNMAITNDCMIGGTGLSWEIFNGLSTVTEFNVAVSMVNTINKGVFSPISTALPNSATAATLPATASQFGDSVTKVFSAGAIGSQIVGSLAAVVTVYTSVNDILDGRKDVGKSELAQGLTDLAIKLPKINVALVCAVKEFNQHIEENVEGLKKC